MPISEQMANEWRRNTQAIKCTHYIRITSSLNIVCSFFFLLLSSYSCCFCCCCRYRCCCVGLSVFVQNLSQFYFRSIFYSCTTKQQQQRQQQMRCIDFVNSVFFVVALARNSSFITSTLTQFNNNNSNKIKRKCQQFNVYRRNSSYGTQIYQLEESCTERKYDTPNEKNVRHKKISKHAQTHTHTTAAERHTSQWCETKAKTI